MKQIEKELASKLLEYASDEFSNHGCNDIDKSFWKGWTKKDKQLFVKEYHDWNGDPEEYDEKCLYLSDWAVMSFLADKLLND